MLSIFERWLPNAVAFEELHQAWTNPLGKEQRLDLDDPLALDRALRAGRLSLYGREIPVARHLAAARLIMHFHFNV